MRSRGQQPILDPILGVPQRRVQTRFCLGGESTWGFKSSSGNRTMSPYATERGVHFPNPLHQISTFLAFLCPSCCHFQLAVAHHVSLEDPQAFTLAPSLFLLVRSAAPTFRHPNKCSVTGLRRQNYLPQTPGKGHPWYMAFVAHIFSTTRGVLLCSGGKRAAADPRAGGWLPFAKVRFTLSMKRGFVFS